MWPIPGLLSPFAAVFYPVSTLPGWMQVLSYALPPSYVFEGLRALVAASRELPLDPRVLPELAARVAARLDTGLAGDLLAFQVDASGAMKAVRPMYAGKVRATVTFSADRPQMGTVRPNLLTAAPPQAGRTAPVTALPWVETTRKGTELVSVESRSGAGEVQLGDARVHDRSARRAGS